MQLKQLTLTNYRSHAGIAVELSPRSTLVAGPYGAGKTSLELAIAAALTGRNTLTDKRGGGLGEQARSGTTGFDIELILEHNGNRYTYQRSKGPKHNLNVIGLNGKPPLTQLDGSRIDALDCRVETALAVMDPRPFLGRTLEEQRTEVSDVIQPSDASVEIPKHIAPLLKTHLAAVTVESIPHAAALYDRAYQLRADAGRKREEIIVPDEPSPVPEGMSLAKIDADIRAFNASLQQLNRERGAIEGRAEHLTKMRAGAPADPAGMADFDAEKVTHYDAEIIRISTEINARREALGASRAEYQEQDRERKRLRGQLDKLRNDTSPTCTECGRKWTTTGRREREEEIQRQISEVSMIITSTEANGKELAMPHHEAERLDQMRNALADLKSRQRVHEQLMDAEAHGKADAERLPLVVAEIDRLTERATKAQAARAALSGMVQAIEAHSAAHKAFKDADRAHEDLQILCEWLGPKGIRAELFKAWVAPFLCEMQGVISNFRPWTVGIDETTMRFTVDSRGAAQLSEGEQLIFEFAYRAALAKRSGLNFVALDSASRLNQRARNILVSLARQMAEDGLQSIITVTMEAREIAERMAAECDADLVWLDAPAEEVEVAA